MKRFCLLVLLVNLCGCNTDFGFADKYDCPSISISKDDSRLFIAEEGVDKFQITLKGYEAFCYTEPTTSRRYASIKPIFKIRRLESGTTSALDVDFYVKTSLNHQDYLGTRNFFQTADIPLNSKEQTVIGKPVITRISMPPYQGFTISLGLKLGQSDRTKSRKMFDIDYSYHPKSTVSSSSDNNCTN